VHGALRKDMFNLAISTFFRRKSSIPSSSCWSWNCWHTFHDALDLAPLFKHVERSLQAKRDDPQFAEWNKRLTVAEVISTKLPYWMTPDMSNSISLGALAEGVVTGIDSFQPHRREIDLKDGDGHRFMEALDFDAAKRACWSTEVEGSSSAAHG
jgi:hypothetical protein